MNSSEGNGSPRWDDDVSEEVRKRLRGFAGAGAVGSAGEEDPKGSPAGDPADANGNGVPHKEARHPEDPPDAVPDAGEEVRSPEQIRIKAAWLGVSARAINSDYFKRLVGVVYDAVHKVRIGAVVMPGQVDAGEQLKIAAATDSEMEKIRSDGKADESKAERIEKNEVPRAEKELEEVGKKVVKTADAVKESRRLVEERQKDGEVEDTTRFWRRSNQQRTLEGRGNLFARISISREKAAAAFVLEVVATASVLTTKVADVFQAPLELAAVIAVALSLAILVASYLAAVAAAAIRIPGRVMGLILVAVYAAVLFKFIPGLNALRESSSEGVDAMTGATLAACFVAGFTGYITATKEDSREEGEERELKKTAGTPLRQAMRQLEEDEDAHRRAQRLEAHLEYALSQLWEEIEKFRDSAERAEVKAQERHSVGVKAEVEAATIEAVAASGVEQERAAADWAIAIAGIAHEKARLEEPPKEDELRLRLLLESERAEAGRKPWSAMQLAALGVLGGGGIASLVLGIVPLGVGASVSVLLVFLDRFRDERESEPGPDPQPEQAHSDIKSPASDEDKDFARQPERMESMYRDVGAEPGKHQ